LPPGESTDLHHWQVLRQWIAVFPGSEFLFGAMILVVGLLRWAALIINGYYRRTPPIRIAGCIIGSLYWATLTIVLVEAPPSRFRLSSASLWCASRSRRSAP